MTAPPDFIEFVAGVIDSTIALTPRANVELGVIHGFCVDAAYERQPHFIEFLAPPSGLAALSSALSQMPQKLQPIDVDAGLWTFVRT